MLYRLKWQKGDKDRRRALPAGNYRLTGYRISRTDSSGTPWFVSTTAHKRRLSVKIGEELRLKIDPAIHINVKAVRCEGKLVGLVSIQGERHGGLFNTHRVGLTIYRDGKRLPARYRATGDDGSVLESGTVAYG